MKKLLSLTAAVLLLITTGCGRSNAPPASASSGTPSVSAPITEPTVESSDDTTPTVQKDEAAVKPQSSRRLDDSRIIPLYSERFTYTDPNGIEDTYFYEVPQIDDDTEDAKHINEMINYRYGYLVERAQDARSRNDFIDTGFIIWVSNWNGPVLSLQVTSSDTLFNHDVGSYHYNFATGQELTNLDLLEYMGYTDSAKTLNALQRATAQHFDVHFGGYDPEYTAMLYKMRAQSLSELDSVFTYYSIFPHFSNGFVVTVPMYTPAGSGMYWTDVQVDPNKRQASGQVLHGQDEWFTCDVTATGKVTVRALTDYVSSDGAVTYQDMKEWYELGDQTEFTVNGCYGNYVKMLMTSVGQDYAPYGFSIRNDPVDGCLFSCNYKDDEWVELENIPVEDTHWQEALALAEKLGLESLPDEKKNSPGLFITDETLDSVCLIYKAPDDEIIYRYLDADGNTRSTLRDFFEDLAGQLQTEGKRGDA